jgi:threonine synthase
VPSTLADRIVLQALRETDGVGVTVSEGAMAVAAANLAALEGVSACLEGAATLAGLRRLYDDGVITPKDQVVLVNTGAARGTDEVPRPRVPIVQSGADALVRLELTPRAS